MSAADIIAILVKQIASPIINYCVKNLKRKNKVIVHYGEQVAFRAFNGEYVQVNLNSDNNKLIACGLAVDAWEIFEVLDANEPFSYETNNPVHYGDKIALRAKENNKFVSVNYRSDQKELTAAIKWVEPWEKFTLVIPPSNSKAKIGKAVHYGHRIALQGCHGEFIMSNQNNGMLMSAIASEIDQWETFAIINPSSPK
jgi:hypothetical protein